MRFFPEKCVSLFWGGFAAQQEQAPSPRGWWCCGYRGSTLSSARFASNEFTFSGTAKRDQ